MVSTVLDSFNSTVDDINPCYLYPRLSEIVNDYSKYLSIGYVLLEYINRVPYINVCTSVIQTIHLFEHCLRHRDNQGSTVPKELVDCKYVCVCSWCKGLLRHCKVLIIIIINKYTPVHTN